MHQVPKVNRKQVSPMVIPRKLCGCYTIMKRDHAHCVGDMLDGDVFTCNVQTAGWRRCDLENLRGRPEYFISWEISTRKSGRRGKRFTEDPYRRLQCVFSSAVFDFLLGNKKKKADYIFIHQRICLSQLYNISI